MIRDLDIGLDEALELTLSRIRALPTEFVGLPEGVDRVVAEDMRARVDSPSVDASLKDGYAVRSGDLAGDMTGDSVRLRLAGSVAAGGREDVPVAPGTAVRVLTGARIPSGADAVVSEEFATPEGPDIVFDRPVEPGRNILPRGSDVSRGRTVVRGGRRLSPGEVGILAAAGHDRIPVVRNPFAAIVATGDEVVAPGRPLPEGKVYASNMATLGSWCRRYGLRTALYHARDDADDLLRTLKNCLDAGADALVTSGGAWTGDRDLVARTLDRLGWEKVFHRIRIGPGKAVGFGLLEGKPVFLLPGGPPSNLMGFLQIALPGLLALGGHLRPSLPEAVVRLDSDLVGRHAHWTQLVFGDLTPVRGDLPVFRPLRGASRLRSMAEARAVVAIPEGETVLRAGSAVAAQILD